MCVCVCACVEAGAAVCLRGWGGVAIPALCNHVLIIPFYVALHLAAYTQSSCRELVMRGFSLRCSLLPGENGGPRVSQKHKAN